MQAEKIGALIRKLRKERQLTQRQLANGLHISDKTVSKWENGKGCPDISLLEPLAAALQTPLEALLLGEAPANPLQGGNMRKTKFYVCPICGNILTAAGEASLSCCGKTLSPLEAQRPRENEDLIIEQAEDEYYITSPHEMAKGHFISFLAFLTGDRLILIRQYPEWELQCRLPKGGRGMLYWYCTQHGLFKKPL